MSSATKERVAQVFQKFDSNKDGKLTREELEGILLLLDTSLDTAKITLIMSQIDTDKDGMISYEEFLDWVWSASDLSTKLMDDLQFCSLPRWMIVKTPRVDAVIPLRAGSSDGAIELEDCALQREIVETVAGPCNGYVMVRLALTSAQGWIHEQCLHVCPEGTREHGRLSSEGKTGDREVSRVELSNTSKRFREVNRFLHDGSDGQLCASQIWFITGHFLGETGMSHGPKTTLFHGTSEDAVYPIIQTGFDDSFAADGKFGTGLYFSPEAMTSYGYGSELFLCEVALGTEDQRVTATEMCSDYTWMGLLREGMRSVQCNAEDFGQEERIVYHCTQCKPVYIMKVKLLEAVLPRWMLHRRTDSVPKTSLRIEPSAAKRCMHSSALNGEVVEVLDRSGPTNEYIFVRLALSESEGWIKNEYLHTCPEGTRDHGRLAASDSVYQEELPLSSSRARELQEMITKGMCSNPCCHCHGIDITIKRAWFILGQFLGETGMKTGPKTTLFHGCPDAVVQLIAQGGFDDHFSSYGKSFGNGLYFSPQSCKAFSYAENHILVCEVALGSEANRLTLTAPSRHMDHDQIRRKGKRSVQCHAGAPFNHEERIVYLPTQCKPVYIIETTSTSPGGGV